MTEEGLKMYTPEDQKYRGNIDITIFHYNEGDVYQPILIMEKYGLEQLAVGELEKRKSNQESDTVVTFNNVNEDFYEEFVIPLTEDLNKKGTKALKDWGINN